MDTRETQAFDFCNASVGDIFVANNLTVERSVCKINKDIGIENNHGFALLSAGQWTILADLSLPSYGIFDVFIGTDLLQLADSFLNSLAILLWLRYGQCDYGFLSRLKLSIFNIPLRHP